MDPQQQLEQQLDLPPDHIEGKAKDGEPIGTKENLYCPANKVSSELYRQNYDQIKWET